MVVAVDGVDVNDTDDDEYDYYYHCPSHKCFLLL